LLYFGVHIFRRNPVNLSFQGNSHCDGRDGRVAAAVVGAEGTAYSAIFPHNTAMETRNVPAMGERQVTEIKGSNMET
jgi:hypothetical protein